MPWGSHRQGMTNLRKRGMANQPFSTVTERGFSSLRKSLSNDCVNGCSSCCPRILQDDSDALCRSPVF